MILTAQGASPRQGWGVWSLGPADCCLRARSAVRVPRPPPETPLAPTPWRWLALGGQDHTPHPCLLHRTELLGNIRQHQPESLLSCIEDPHATQRFAPCPTSQPALHFFNFLPPKRKDCVKTPLLYQVQCSHTHLSHSHTDKPNRTKSRSWAGQFISRSPAAPACGCAASSSRARSA